MIKRNDNPFKTNKMSTHTNNISDNSPNNDKNNDQIEEFVRICRYFDIKEHEKLALLKIPIFEQIFSNNYIYNIKNIDSTIQTIQYYQEIDFNDTPFIIHERFKLIKSAFSGSCSYIKNYLTPYGLSLLEDEQTPLCQRYRKEVSKHISQYVYWHIKYLNIKDDYSEDDYPLESYVTYMSHRNLQGAPTESSENSSIGRILLRIRKDDNEYESGCDTEPDPAFDEYVGGINLETNPYAIANGGRPFIPDNVDIEQLNAFYAMAQM